MLNACDGLGIAKRNKKWEGQIDMCARSMTDGPLSNRCETKYVRSNVDHQ